MMESKDYVLLELETGDTRGDFMTILYVVNEKPRAAYRVPAYGFESYAADHGLVTEVDANTKPVES